MFLIRYTKMGTDELPGCKKFYDAGRLRFFDGHVHCNHPQSREFVEREVRANRLMQNRMQKPESESEDAVLREALLTEPFNPFQRDDSAPGFMIGAHGMSSLGCTQYGFLFVDSKTDETKIRVWYFEEQNSEKDNYEQILECVKGDGGMMETDAGVNGGKGGDKHGGLATNHGGLATNNGGLATNNGGLATNHGGLAACTHLAVLWGEIDLRQDIHAKGQQNLATEQEQVYYV
jgi:hypothetical protein